MKAASTLILLACALAAATSGADARNLRALHEWSIHSEAADGPHDDRRLWGWLRSFGKKAKKTKKPTPPPTPAPPQPQNHDHGDAVFKLKRVANADIADHMTLPSAEAHDVIQGMWWLDQHGSHVDSDVSAVAAADMCMTFGESEHYVLPTPEVVEVQGETHTLRHRYDIEVFGADAWQWTDEGGDADDGENHSFAIASPLHLYYKFIWNDDHTFCRIVFTAKILGKEIEMPTWLATYWMKRGWGGEDDPTGLTWDRLSFIGPHWVSWFSSEWHYPVFKVMQGAGEKVEKTEFFDAYLKLANCKCGTSKAEYKACIAEDSPTYKCETSLVGYNTHEKGAAAANKKAQIALGKPKVTDFAKSWTIAL